MPRLDHPVICDICGDRCKFSQSTTSNPDHKGLVVCPSCQDEPHFKRKIKPENIGLKDPRPLDESGFTGCNSISAVPGDATPGCMVPGVGI